MALSAACVGFGAVASCANGGDNTGGSNSSSGASNGGSGGDNDATASSGGNGSGGNGSGGNGSGGNGSGGNGSGGNGSGGNGSGGNGSGGNSTSGSGGNGSGGNGSGGNSSGGNGSGGNGSGGNSSGGNGSGGNSSGASSTGGSSGASSSGAKDSGAEGGGGCTNTDMTKINIDPSGFACNNQWGITGAWYCFADTTGTSSCPGGTAGTGVIPINTTGDSMCLSGKTAGSMPSATAYGAAIGVELNHVNPDAGPKSAYNAKAKNIIGFAITISGDSGGSILNVNFPPAQTMSGEAPGVTVPGVTSGSPITYNVLLADAVMSDNSATPIPKVIDPTNVTDVQLKIDVDGTAHTYNFCITKIVPIMAAPAAPGALTTYGPTFNEGKQIVVTGLGPYGVQNDPFNVGSDLMSMQVSYGGGQVGFTATPTFTSGSTTPGAFPSVAYGWIHGGNFVGGSNAGAYTAAKTIGSLGSVTSSWSFTAGSGNWDAAYDCWFGGNSDSINPGSELMVWLAHGGVNPIGGQNTPITISGPTGTWTYSTGTNGTGQPVVSYVSSASMTSVTNFNLLPFFKEAASSGRAGLSTGSYLLGCQAGFELYNPGTWKTTSYSMTAN